MRSRLLVKARGNIHSAGGLSCVAPFFLSRAGQYETLNTSLNTPADQVTD